MFNFITLYNGNLVVNTGNAFSVIEATTGNILFTKKDYVVSAATPDSLYSLKVESVRGFMPYAQYVVKMDYETNVTQEFNIGFLGQSIKVQLILKNIRHKYPKLPEN